MPTLPPEPPIRHRRLWNALTLLALLALIGAAAWHAYHAPSLPAEAVTEALPDPYAADPAGEAANLLSDIGPEPAPKAAATDTLAPADSTLLADSLTALPADTMQQPEVVAPEPEDTL